MNTNKELFNQLLDTIKENYSAAEMKTAEILSTIASTISTKRIEMRLNQSQFAKKLGITQEMVSKLEKGDYNFTIRQVIKIFDTLGLDVDFTIHTADEYSAHVESPFKIIDYSEHMPIFDEKSLRKIPLEKFLKKEAIAS